MNVGRLKMTNPKPLAKWIPQVFGNPDGESWEISVIREDNEHGRRSWGWFDQDKLNISHNGGPCRWPLGPGLGKFMVELASKYAEYLNERESLGLEINSHVSLLDLK